MTGNRLYKYEKLCSRKSIDAMFVNGSSVIAYPMRAVFTLSDMSEDATPARFLIAIPKKKIRKAVKRVLLRRRVREAYRLNRNIIFPKLTEQKLTLEIAFLYLSNEIADYATIDAKIKDLLRKISVEIDKMTDNK